MQARPRALRRYRRSRALPGLLDLDGAVGLLARSGMGQGLVHAPVDEADVRGLEGGLAGDAVALEAAGGDGVAVGHIAPTYSAPHLQRPALMHLQ